MILPRADLLLGDRVAIAIAAVSMGTLLVELTWPHELDAPAPGEEMSLGIAETTARALLVGPPSDYSAVTARPLFTPDRRPFVAAADPAPAESAGPRIDFELTAVIIASAAQIALLRSNVTPISQRVTLNQTIDGWTLAEVTPEAVVLRRGAESMTVPLRPEASESRSGQAARLGSLDRGN